MPLRQVHGVCPPAGDGYAVEGTFIARGLPVSPCAARRYECSLAAHSLNDGIGQAALLELQQEVGGFDDSRLESARRLVEVLSRLEEKINSVQVRAPSKVGF